MAQAMEAALIHVGDFRDAFLAVLEEGEDEELASVECDLSIEEVRAITSFEQIEKIIQNETGEGADFVEGAPVTVFDHEMSANLALPNGVPQPTMLSTPAPPSDSTSPSTPTSAATGDHIVLPPPPPPAASSPTTPPDAAQGKKAAGKRKRKEVNYVVNVDEIYAPPILDNPPPPPAASPPTSNGQPAAPAIVPVDPNDVAAPAIVPVDPNDVVLSIAFFHQNKPVKTQEYLVLGSQPLTVLRDRIYCLSDHIYQTPTRPKKNSAYFFFENAFYNDMRKLDAVDYSQTVIDWAANNPRFVQPALGPLVSVNMQDATFADLTLRVGAAYLYCHQGDCQHVMTVTDVRLINKSDNQNQNAYPLQTFQTKIRRRKCRVCDIYPAKCVTVGDHLSPENPCFFCDQCYHPLHYDEKNTLLYKDYSVYPYYHE